MDVETNKTNRLKFQDLPEEIYVYLVEVYPFGAKLFFTGIMDNGQTLNIVGTEFYKEIYFVLKDQMESPDAMSDRYLEHA
jgi:hypothetical protein